MHLWCTPSPWHPKFGLKPPLTEARVCSTPPERKTAKTPLKPEFWPSGEDNPSPDVRKNWTPWENFGARSAPNFFRDKIFQNLTWFCLSSLFIGRFFLAKLLVSTIGSLKYANLITTNNKFLMPFWPPLNFFGNQVRTDDALPPLWGNSGTDVHHLRKLPDKKILPPLSARTMQMYGKFPQATNWFEI